MNVIRHRRTNSVFYNLQKRLSEQLIFRIATCVSCDMITIRKSISVINIKKCMLVHNSRALLWLQEGKAFKTWHNFPPCSWLCSKVKQFLYVYFFGLQSISNFLFSDTFSKSVSEQNLHIFLFRFKKIVHGYSFFFKIKDILQKVIKAIFNWFLEHGI